jgi:hypothetical protein
MISRRLLQRATILFFFLVALAARAQSYEPGWVLRSTGDTLRGEVENGFWNEPPAFVRFRPTAGSASQLLQPQQVRAFGLTGGRYFRFEVLPIDHAAETRLALLPQGNAHNVQQDSLLAEVLLEGPVTLLRVARPAVLHLLLLRPNPPRARPE